MKKLRKRLGLNPTLSIVIIMVSVLVMAGVVFGIVGLSELLTVRADNTATVSPTDGDGEEVSGSDATNPKRRNITGSISPRIFNDDGDPEGDPTEVDTGKEIPFTMTHLITMNDGSTISSAVPSTEGDPTGRIWNYNDGGEVNHQTVHQNQPTMTGTLYYGYNFGMYFSSYVAQRTTFIGSVKVNLNDGRTIDWNVGSTWSDTYDREHSYAFNWSSVQPQLDAIGKGYDDIESIDINIIFGTPHPLLLTVQRHNSDDIVRISPKEDVLYNRIFDASLHNKYKGSGGTGCMRVDDAKTGVTSAQFAEGVTDTTFAKAVSSRGFYWVDLANEGRTIQQIRARDVNGSDITSSCVFQDESGRFYFKMSNGYNCTMDVITAPSDVYKIKVEATSSDFSMNCIELSDSSNNSTFYTGSITNMRYSDAACTNPIRVNSNTYDTYYQRNASNAHTSDDGKTVTFTQYHRNKDINWYLAVVCYDRGRDSYMSYNTSGNLKITSLYDIHITRDSDGADVTESLGAAVKYKSGSPYLQFKPPAYDITVRFDQRLMSTIHSLKVHEKRPTTNDTVWVTKFKSVDYNHGGYMYTKGTATSYASLGSAKNTCGTSNNSFYFPSNKLEETWDIGWLVTGKDYQLEFNNYSGNWDNSTMVKSWKAVNAATGEEISLAPTLHYDGAEDKDYVNFVGLKWNSGIFDFTNFTMPDCDVIIEIEYGKTIGACSVKQQIVAEDGTASPVQDGDFKVTFEGTGRDADTTAFIKGENKVNTFDVTSAEDNFGVYRASKNVKFTVTPKDGYVLSYVKVRPTISNNDLAGSLTRSGDTFTTPDSMYVVTSSYGGNGIMYELTFSYTKVAKVEINQSSDGAPVPGSTTQIGTVTLSSQNSGTFVNPESTGSNNLTQSYVCKLTEGDAQDGSITKTSIVNSSAGNKLKISVKVNPNSSRVLSKVSVRRVSSDDELHLTAGTSTYDSMEYTVDDALLDDDHIVIDVEYMTANHIMVDVLEKEPGTQTSMKINTTSAYAEITGSGAATTLRGYQFILDSDRTVTCDSFTSTGSVVNYLTTGNTKLTLNVKEIPEGYVVANVEASLINNGKPGTHAEGLTPSSTSLDGYGICYDYSSNCTINTLGRNLYIRVYLAKTAQVTVRFRSRNDQDNAVFDDNTVSGTYATFEHSNSAYGSGEIYPVIVENDSGSKYNTKSYTVTNNPSERSVLAVDRVKLTGTISMPKGYTIASVTAIRVKNRDGVETLNPTLRGYTYKTESGAEKLQATFALPEQLDSGYQYDITVNIERVTNVELKMYHSNENGTFDLNTVTGSNATLNGVRSSDDAGSVYSNAEYKSTVPFQNQTGSNAAPTGSVSVTKNKPQNEFYVLRSTEYTLRVAPASIDSVYKVKAYDPDGDEYVCTKTATDENGTETYSVTLNDSAVKSQMNRKVIFEVYFADLRTEGTVIVENRNYVTEEPIYLDGGVTLSLSNVLYSKPATTVPGGMQLGGSVSVTEPSATYSIIVGTKTTLSGRTNGMAKLYCYTVQYKDEELRTYYPGDSGYSLNLNVTEDGEVKVVNYYIQTASVILEADYGHTSDEEESWKIRSDIKYLSQCNALFMNVTAKKGDEVVQESSVSTATKTTGSVVTGAASDYTLTVRELAGYTLEKLEVYRSGGGSWTFTREQLTSQAVPGRGSNDIVLDPDRLREVMDETEFAQFSQSFSKIKGGSTYSFKAYFKALLVYVTAYEMDYDNYVEMRAMGFQNYMREHSDMLAYHAPQRCAELGDYSVDGFHYNTDIYFDDQGSIGVRYGSSPKCTVPYQYHISKSGNSTYYEYYRLGGIYYGSSISTQTSRLNGSALPLSIGLGYDFNMGTITGDSYLTVIYVKYTDEDIQPPDVKPENYSSADTVVGNTKLTVNYYYYNEQADSYQAVSADMIEQIAGNMKVTQKCIGYCAPSSAESAKYSNTEHHANYVPGEESEDDPIIYHHDDLPTVYEYDMESGTFVSRIAPIAADTMNEVEHPTYSITQDRNLSIAAANNIFAVKCNNIDDIKVKLTANAPGNTVLQKMEINRNGAITTKSDNCNYEYTPALGDNITVSYYFGRPMLEVGTNNTTDNNKGTIELNNEVIVRDTDYMQAIRFTPDEQVTLVIKPKDGFEFDYIMAGSSRSTDMPFVSQDKITQVVGPDGQTVTYVDLGKPSKNVYVQVQFRATSQESLALLTVNQFRLDSSGTAIPIEEGKVNITAVGNGTELLIVGNNKGTTLTLQNSSSISANVVADSELQFALHAPTGWSLAADPFLASYKNRNDNTDNQIDPEHTDGSVIYTIPASVVQQDRAITVNVYFLPTYHLIYDGNGNTGGTSPTDSHSYASGTIVSEFADKGSLVRSGYIFNGWSTVKGGQTPVDSVTFADEDITLYAIWVEKTSYTVTYKPGRGAGNDVVETVTKGGNTIVKSGDVFTPPNNEVFDKWVCDTASYSTTPGDAITVSNDIVYTATFKSRYTVTYQVTGIPSNFDYPATQTDTYDDGTTIDLKAKPEGYDETNYTFIGWNSEDIDTSAASFKVTKNIVITGQFKSRYTVTYQVTGIPSGFEYPATQTDTYDDGTTVDLKAKPEGYDETKYTFIGWNSEDIDTSAASFKVTKNIVITGYFDEISQPPVPSTCTVSYTSGLDSSHGGFNESCASPFVLDNVPTGDYTVLDNGAQNGPQFSPERYTFIGWRMTAASGGRAPRSGAGEGSIIKAGDTVTLSGDVTLRGVWQCKLKYDANGGSGKLPNDGNEILQYVDDKVTAAAGSGLTSGDGTFHHWNTNPDDSGAKYPAGSSFTIKDDTTLYAIYSNEPIVEEKFTVTYNSNGGTGTTPKDENQYSVGASVTVASKGDLVRAGCTFKEWNTTADGKGDSYVGDGTGILIMPNKNVTLYAIWVDDSGKVIPSPGTGESDLPLQIAFNMALLAFLAGGFVAKNQYNRRRKKAN